MLYLLRVLILIIVSQATSAQLVGMPAERQFMPIGGFGAPLWNSEVGLNSDRELHLIHGPVLAWEVRRLVYQVEEEGWNDDIGRARFTYDACGNLTEVLSFSVDPVSGDSWVDAKVTLKPVYSGEGCRRLSSKYQVTGEYVENKVSEVGYVYREGVLAEAGFWNTQMTFEREGGAIRRMTVRKTDLDETVTYTFDIESGRLAELDHGSGSVFITTWSGENTFRLESKADADMWFDITLDAKGNVGEVRMAENRLFGHRQTYTYTYDEQGNWTERLLSGSRDLDGELVPIEKYRRTLTYRTEP